MEKGYTGTQILEDMSFAHNYNGFIKKLINRFVSRKESQTVIDYGAGNGEFCLNSFQNIDFFAVEPDKYLQEKLRNNGINVLELKNLRYRSIDFVYTINVLEHIENDEEVLQEIYDILAFNGKVLIYVPAFQFLWTGLDDQVKHFRRYTKKSLSKKLEKCGFKIKALKYADSIGFFVLALHKLLNIDVRLNKRNIILFDKILFPLSRILDQLIFENFFGKNIYTYAEKQSLKK